MTEGRARRSNEERVTVPVPRPAARELAGHATTNHGGGRRGGGRLVQAVGGALVTDAVLLTGYRRRV